MFVWLAPAIFLKSAAFSSFHRSEDMRWIGPLQDLVTWYRIDYAGTQITQWDFQNKGTLTSPARLSFVSDVPLHYQYLCPSIIYSIPYDWILQRAYYLLLWQTDHLWSIWSQLTGYCSEFSLYVAICSAANPKTLISCYQQKPTKMHIFALKFFNEKTILNPQTYT